MEESVYHSLGTKPVINALGIYTDLGGSILSPKVWSAMEQANRSFVDVVDLLEQSGRVIADLLGAESARVIPGASAAIALCTAACMTGTDGEKMERLPKTAGMRSKILIQKRHRYKYDRMVHHTGAQLTEVGDEGGTTPEQIAGAIDSDTAAFFFPAHLAGVERTVQMPDVIEIAHGKGVPVIVDAAYLNYPVERMSSFTEAGADLVCFSAKYFGGPNAGGFVCGERELIDAVAAVDFTGFESGEYLVFGRPFKLDRQTIVGVVASLQEWMALDHDARFAGYVEKVETLSRELHGFSAIKLTPMNFTMAETLEPEPTNCLHIEINPGVKKSAEEIASALSAGDPGVLVHCLDNALVVVMETLRDGDELRVAARLKRELA